MKILTKNPKKDAYPLILILVEDNPNQRILIKTLGRTRESLAVTSTG